MLSVASLSFSYAGGAAPRAAVMRASSAAMQVEAPVAAEPLKMDLVEPVFPEVCEYAGITLSRYVLEMARANTRSSRSSTSSSPL